MTAAEPSTEGSSRDRIAAVEPGGNEYIAEADRHGKPSQLLWTWASPNLEFATIFVGVLAVAYYGMTFWQAVAGLVMSRLAALDPDRLTATDRFEIVVIALLRHEPETAARFVPPASDAEPRTYGRSAPTPRLSDRSSRTRSGRSVVSRASASPAWILTSASDGSVLSRWPVPTRPPCRVKTSSLRSPMPGRSD